VRDVVLRIRSSGRFVPAIGTPLIPGTYFCAMRDIGAGADVARRATSISAKAASQLTAFQPAVLSRCRHFRQRCPLSDTNRTGNGIVGIS